MARSIWSGSVSFGLVNVPVSMYSATQDSTVHFNQFQKGTSARIRLKRVNEDTGREVDYEDIVKGYDLGDGKYVIVTPEELESVEPGRSRTIEITDFVEAADVDPIYFDTTYYLAPKDDSAAKAYRLLLRALEESERIAVATFVMRDKQHLAAIRPLGDVLALETMRFADEVRDPHEVIEDLPKKATVSARDLDAARMLIDAMATEWDPDNYRDTYRDRVMALIKAKAKGREVVVEHDAEAAPNVVDLMAALQASVDAAKGRRPGNAHQAGKLATRKASDSTSSGSSKRPKRTSTTRAKRAATPAKRSSSSRPRRAAS